MLNLLVYVRGCVGNFFVKYNYFQMQCLKYLNDQATRQRCLRHFQRNYFDVMFSSAHRGKSAMCYVVPSSTVHCKNPVVPKVCPKYAQSMPKGYPKDSQSISKQKLLTSGFLQPANARMNYFHLWNYDTKKLVKGVFKSYRFLDLEKQPYAKFK